MAGSQTPTYKAEPADQRIIEPLAELTLIYQRRSGTTHIVAEPVPEILAAMGDDSLAASEILERLATQFELEESADGEAAIAARLAELETLGLVERVAGRAA